MSSEDLEMHKVHFETLWRAVGAISSNLVGQLAVSVCFEKLRN